MQVQMIKIQGKNCYVNGIIDSKQQQVTRLEVFGWFHVCFTAFNETMEAFGSRV